MPLIAYYAKSFSSVDAVVYHYERRNPQARTYQAVNGVFDLFAYTREIESIRRVVRFLIDKEPCYLEMAENTKLERLLEYRGIALKNNSRNGFRIMCDWIMETPAKYRKHIGWVGLKTIRKSNYTISRLIFKVKKRYRYFAF